MSLAEETTPAPAKPKRQRKPSQSVAVHKAQPPVAPITGNMLILKQAMDNGATGEDLKLMLELYERMEASAAKKAFDAALSLAIGEIPAIVKNRLVAFEATKPGGRDTSYRHEDLAEIVKTIRPILHKHGLRHGFRTSQDMQNGGLITVTCIITGHGHQEETSLSSGPDQNGSGMNNLQRIASAVTYLERYTLKAILGLAASHDDDAHGTTAETGTITALQLKELEALIKEVDAKADNVCKACKVETLAEMTVTQFEKAKAKLEAMRAPL